MSDQNKLWARMGMTFSITPQEAEKIIHSSPEEHSQILARLFSEGRARLEGECYIPQSALQQYCLNHGTQYLADDIDLEIGSLDGKPLKLGGVEIMKPHPKPKGRDER